MPGVTSHHRVGGLVVAIDAPADPLFEHVPPTEPDILIQRVERETVDRVWEGPVEAARHGDVVVAVSADGGWLVRYPEWFDAVVDADGRHIRVWERERWSGLGRVLFATVVPLALALHGRVPFHGSAVSVDGWSLVLVGETGAGKSTLATALCLEGARLLADDLTYARLDAGGTVVIEPSPGATRLYREVAERMGQATCDPLADKHLLSEPFVRSAGTSAPLAGMQILERHEGGGARLTSALHGADAVVVVLHHMLAALGRSREGQALQHQVAMAITTRSTVRRMAWAPDPSVAREVARELIEGVRQERTGKLTAP